jgi:hypothetical protein
MIWFAFRRPKFPLICGLDGDLVAAASGAALQSRLGGVDLANDKKMQFVDTSGESWMMLPDQMILAAEFFPRRWRKIAIINLFNGSRATKERGVHYPERRLGNRRLDTIIREVAALLAWEQGVR